MRAHLARWARENVFAGLHNRYAPAYMAGRRGVNATLRNRRTGYRVRGDK